LQDKATDSVGDLVGVFKGDVVAPTTTFTAKDLYVPNVKPAVTTDLDLTTTQTPLLPEDAKPRDSSMRRKSTGTHNVATRSDSRLSNVADGGGAGARQPRRNRRSSGFLSLLGYATTQYSFLAQGLGFKLLVLRSPVLQGNVLGNVLSAKFLIRPKICLDFRGDFQENTVCMTNLCHLSHF